MRLSIFNSKPLKATILFFGIIVVIMGVTKMWLLNQVPAGLVPLSQHFWLAKTHTEKKFDVIVIGDSRVYRGVSPTAMSSILKGCSVFNFGFSNSGLSRTLLQAGEEKLDPTGLKIIVLGVSPLTLTGPAALNKHYTEYKNISRFHHHFGPLDKLFDPKLTMLAFANLFSHLDKTRGYFQIPHSDGWVESSRIPEKPDRALKSYKRMLTKYKVSREIETELFQITAEQKRNGITVFAFRPPSSQKMEELENKISGFNEKRFKKEFSQAGGIWIDIEDRFEFISYDGSHLRGDSAKLFSRYLAEVILEYTKKNGNISALALD
jgi:hypothetical protein